MSALLAFILTGAALLLFAVFVWYERMRELDAYRSKRAIADQKTREYIAHAQHAGEVAAQHLSVRTIAQTVIHTLAYYTARIARVIERKAHKITHTMSRPGMNSGATRSSFLQEVQEHKKNLDTETVRRDNSFVS